LVASGAILVVGSLADRSPRARSFRGAWLWLALAALSGGWYTARLRELPRDSLAHRVVPHEPTTLTLDGIILTDPRQAPRDTTTLARFLPRPPAWRLEFESTGVVLDSGSSAVSGRVWVHVAGETHPTHRAGSRVRITGRFSPLSPPQNAGEPDPRPSAAQRGFVGRLDVSSASLILPLESSPGLVGAARSAWLRARADLQARARDVIERASRGDARTTFLVRGLLLGDFDPSQREVREAFARQGLAHALSISGFHLAVMSGVLLLAIRLTGERGWLEPTVVAAFVVAYASIVPATSPILRSAAMVLVLLAAEACGRRYDRLTILGWTAIGLLAWRPLDLWNLGYQLSVGLTAMLLWAGEHWNDAVWGARIKGLASPREVGVWTALRGHGARAVSAALLCWLVSTPVLMHRVGLISPLAVIATVLITPLLIVLLWIAFIALLIGMAAPDAAPWAGWALHALSVASIDTTLRFDAWAWSSVRVPPTSAWWAIAATGVLVLWTGLGRWRDARGWIALALCLAWLGAEWSLKGRLDRRTSLRIDTLSIGDGTCHLLRSGDDVMMWDCGPASGAGLLPEAVSACRALGVWRIPTLVISHPDLDHFAGLDEVVRHLGVRRVLVPQRFLDDAERPGGAAGEAASLLARHGIEVLPLHAGATFRLGLADATILSPPPDATWAHDNDHSLVVAFDVPRPEDVSRLLLTGDIQDDAIARLASLGGIHADVLELPHHGSARDAAIAFTAATNPRVVIQSTGRRRLNDPRWDPIRAGRAWLCTADRGSVWVELRDDGSIRHGAMRSATLQPPTR